MAFTECIAPKNLDPRHLHYFCVSSVIAHFHSFFFTQLKGQIIQTSCTIQLVRKLESRPLVCRLLLGPGSTAPRRDVSCECQVLDRPCPQSIIGLGGARAVGQHCPGEIKCELPTR